MLRGFWESNPLTNEINATMNQKLLFIAVTVLCSGSLQSQILFGNTFGGGVDNAGTILKFTNDTKQLTVLKSLGGSGSAPASGLIQASDGKLYGMSTTGGVDNFGGIFSYDPVSGTYSVLNSLADINGRYPTGSLMQASDGKLYGMTNGGRNDNGGILFSFDPISSVITKLFDFDINLGEHPYGSLIQGKDGKLYGTAYDGGMNQNYDGVVFSFDISTATYADLGGFGWPRGDLVQTADGKFYGLNSADNFSKGSIFVFDPTNQSTTVVHSFDAAINSDGSLMLASDGKLYGLATDGGSKNGGFLFSVDPVLSVYNKVLDFDSTTGSFPVGTLIHGNDGRLYAMTRKGGSHDYGTIFSFDPSSSSLSKLGDFTSNVESFQVGSLTQANDGKFYGVTAGEGRNNKGAVFSFDPITMTFSILKTFTTNQSASNTSAALMRSTDGKLYGLSTNGGTSSGGVIYSYDPVSGAYEELKNLDYENGNHPYGGLVQGTDKKLYGMTTSGGVWNVFAPGNTGTLFSFDPLSGIYSKLINFHGYGGSDGINPFGSFLQATDGKLYGMASSGGHNGYRGSGSGTIFSYDTHSSKFNWLFDFADVDLGGITMIQTGPVHTVSFCKQKMENFIDD